ncbi:copper amine oxidase N-terminal domain-containing protein [Desulforamulus ferrireducens]
MTAPAQIIKGSTLVPLRFVGEAFGCDVQWNNATQTATIKNHR